MKSNQQYLLPFVMVTSLFFLWAFLHNINPILIPHLKKACELTDTQSALIDFSVYIGYFLAAELGIVLAAILMVGGFLYAITNGIDAATRQAQTML